MIIVIMIIVIMIIVIMIIIIRPTCLNSDNGNDLMMIIY